ncbi:MAG TPA: hypothetical protein VKA95_03025 [Nitrososphaeraceae archaeon]|nr:hypothetical protein [Nitrososphaeraceae archaeon]
MTSNTFHLVGKQKRISQSGYVLSDRIILLETFYDNDSREIKRDSLSHNKKETT